MTQQVPISDLLNKVIRSVLNHFAVYNWKSERQRTAYII